MLGRQNVCLIANYSSIRSKLIGNEGQIQGSYRDKGTLHISDNNVTQHHLQSLADIDVLRGDRPINPLPIADLPLIGRMFLEGKIGIKIKINSSLYSRYYAEACNE